MIWRWWHNWPTASWCSTRRIGRRKQRPGNAGQSQRGLYQSSCSPCAPSENIRTSPSRKRILILEIENVSASYSGKETEKVLEDINLKIRRGRTVALVGESGSGKSTLARVITGLLPPLGGKVIFEGNELPPALKSRDRESLRQVQMIYQMPDTALNPRHKVRKIIGRPLSFYFHNERQRNRKPGPGTARHD